MYILTYHSLDTSGSCVSIEPSVFQQQMNFLYREGIQGTSLIKAVNFYQQYKKWPKNTVVVTFDDGYENIYHEAFPVLKKYGFHATLFIISGAMGNYNDWRCPLELGKKLILSWRQTEEMLNYGFEIGNHTRNHIDFTQSSKEKILEEIQMCDDDIQKHLGIKSMSFAYPFGYKTKYSEKIVQKKFNCACTTILQPVKYNSLHILPRIDTYYFSTLKSFQKLNKNELNSYITMRHWGRKLKQYLETYK